MTFYVLVEYRQWQQNMVKGLNLKERIGMLHSSSSRESRLLLKIVAFSCILTLAIMECHQMVLSKTPIRTYQMEFWKLSVHIYFAIAQFCKLALTETSAVQHKMGCQGSRENMRIFTRFNFRVNYISQAESGVTL